MVVTQNVDGLHAKAGTSPEKLIELHGTNAEVECQRCQARTDPDVHFRAFAETRRPPTCPCGGYLKPATISFGQTLRTEDLEAAFAAAEETDLVLALGSTLSVQPAATIPLVALRRGVPYVIINRGETDHDGLPGLTLRLEGDVGAFLPEAVRAVVEDGPS
jgi:NAD-dependent deacetylase